MVRFLVWLTHFLDGGSLTTDLTKIMVLQYSSQETSVTIGESVRDEDGLCPCPLSVAIRRSLN